MRRIPVGAPAAAAVRAAAPGTLRLALVAAVALAAGCGSDGPGPAPATAPYRRGSIVAESSRYRDGTRMRAHAQLSAYFAGSPRPSVCDAPPLGTCAPVACVLGALPASAGVVALSGGKVPVSVEPSPDHAYPQATGEVALWDGGEPLTFLAEGELVPRFQVTVTAPRAVTLTRPALPAGSTTLTVARGADLALAWTPGLSGTAVTVVLAPGDATPALTCRFRAADGHASIPAAKVPTVEGSWAVLVTSDADVTAGAWPVHVQAESYAVGADGTRLTGPYHLQ